jgi:hypothetical protein
MRAFQTPSERSKGSLSELTRGVAPLNAVEPENPTRSASLECLLVLRTRLAPSVLSPYVWSAVCGSPENGSQEGVIAGDDSPHDALCELRFAYGSSWAVPQGLSGCGPLLRSE